jgi:hypothetical protein
MRSSTLCDGMPAGARNPIDSQQPQSFLMTTVLGDVIRKTAHKALYSHPLAVAAGGQAVLQLQGVRQLKGVELTNRVGLTSQVGRVT